MIPPAIGRGHHGRLPGRRPWLMAALIGFGVLAASLTGAEAGPKPSPEEEGARLVLNRWIEAMGGPYELAALKTADYVCEISFGNSTPPIPVYLRATADGRYRYDYTLPTYGLLIQA